VYDLNEIEQKYRALEKELLAPETIANKERYTELTREFNRIARIMGDGQKLRQVERDMSEYNEMLSVADEGMREEINTELDHLERLKEELEKKILIGLVPPDPLDDKNIIMEPGRSKC